MMDTENRAESLAHDESPDNTIIRKHFLYFDSFNRLPLTNYPRIYRAVLAVIFWLLGVVPFVILLQYYSLILFPALIWLAAYMGMLDAKFILKNTIKREDEYIKVYEDAVRLYTLPSKYPEYNYQYVSFHKIIIRLFRLGEWEVRVTAMVLYFQIASLFYIYMGTISGPVEALKAFSVLGSAWLLGAYLLHTVITAIWWRYFFNRMYADKGFRFEDLERERRKNFLRIHGEKEAAKALEDAGRPQD